MMDWRTHIDPKYTLAYGCSELHAVFFEPNDDTPGERISISISIPENSRQEVKSAMKLATKKKARVVFVCDTQSQAIKAADFASSRLPNHRRIAYERAEAGGWGLSRA